MRLSCELKLLEFDSLGASAASEWRFNHCHPGSFLQGDDCIFPFEAERQLSKKEPFDVHSSQMEGAIWVYYSDQDRSPVIYCIRYVTC